jgi:hypothetical protein
MLRIYTPITLKDQTTEVYSQAKRERITAASLRILRGNLKGRPLRKELLTTTPTPRPLGTISFKTTKYTGRQRLSRATIFQPDIQVVYRIPLQLSVESIRQ